MSFNKTVAIVIPSRNEERYIFKCLNSILNQDYPLELMEVYVCDGLSNDQTQTIVKGFEVKYLNIHLLLNEKQTTPYALNLGIEKSNSDVVIILGAHAELHHDYVSKCVGVLEKYPEVGCAGGILENIYENSTAETIGMAMSSAFGVGNAHFRTGNKEGYVDTVAFGAYRRQVFEKAGLFDAELVRNQDDEYNFRMQKYGYKIFLSMEIKSKYYVRSSYKKLFRQYFQYGYWKVYVNKKHRTITSLRQMAPLFFVLFIAAGLLASILFRVAFYGYLAVLSLYLITGFLSAMKIADRFMQTFGVMFTFFLLHLGYGSGYFVGISDFLLFGKKIKGDEKITR